MGRDEWHSAQDWPPPESRETALYLHSEGRANTRHGNGSLQLEPPTRKEPPDQFDADPQNLVPPEPPGGEPPPRSAMFRPVDRGALQDRADVLIYSAKPVTRELVVAGAPRAELWVSADTPDADWVVKITVVSPDGAARAVAEGILRSSFRDSETEPRPIKPGKLYRMQVDLGHTAFAVAAGHALRVEIAASCFPMYDRNTNTGEGPFAVTARKARQTVYHRPGAASRIMLPVLIGQ
jgi:putative CocE/NonD family hydrolase